jgi:thiamine biosynthesis lipoprotein ApbE
VNADALDTGLFVLGPARGKNVASSMGIAALFVDDAGRLRFSEKAAERFSLVQPVNGGDSVLLDSSP